ncbi:hypothetical protein Agabi119p4_7818 [Agaricus bisporus var. burnettii]|uniref:Uncharacterized protein n=1 Tax=Agaricus bisporus var. burnettii TaxID=192524 RepID=A0A8H7EZV3_AGABI|nr:hypothetical protein Agabi119p4_7818 [Agaricus bisporus var. burnettii]
MQRFANCRPQLVRCKTTWAGVGIASPGTQGPDYLPHLGTESSQHLLHAIEYNKDSPLRLSLMITSQLMFSSNLCITANGGALEELEFHIHLLPSRVFEVVPSVIHGRRIPVLNIVRLDRPALRATTLIRYADQGLFTLYHRRPASGLGQTSTAMRCS